jgi:hypothetical protein
MHLAKALERARVDIGVRSGLSEKRGLSTLGTGLGPEIARLRSPAASEGAGAQRRSRHPSLEVVHE